jgi:hypothetical protein
MFSLAKHKELIVHANALCFQSGDEIVMASWQFLMTQCSSRATSLKYPKSVLVMLKEACVLVNLWQLILLHCLCAHVPTVWI